jgi:hypothetical protein
MNAAIVTVSPCDLRLPEFAAGARVDGDGVPVEQVVDDFAVAVGRPAVDGVAARDAEGGRVHVGAVLEAQRKAFLRQVKGVQHVGERRHDVHRVVHDEGLAFMTSEHAGRKAPQRAQPRGVGGGDLREGAVACRGVVLAGKRPLRTASVLRLQQREQREAQHYRCG